MRIRSAVLAALCTAALVVSACGKTSEGEPVAEGGETVAETAASVTMTSAQTTRAIPTPEVRSVERK
jgi:outer membrane lipoprotein-sorting protein